MPVPPAMRQRLNMSETFTAIVGESETKFILYTDIATRSSKFFDAAMNRNWMEGEERQVTLADVDEDAFEGYLQWLNTGEITFWGVPSMWDLTHFYILGDFLDDSAFRAVSLDWIANVACDENASPCRETIALAWDETAPGSALRKLYLEICAASRCIKCQMDHYTNPDNGYPHVFIVDFLQHLVLSRGVHGFNVCDNERKRRIQQNRRALEQE